ncbi:MAG: hypothetical protein VXY07_15095 [Planctomycetota bacterium]|nr:hypothetical protein [Planctomycetota bacterium]
MQLRSRLCTASRLDTASGLDTTSRLFNLFAAGSFAAAHQATKLSFENAATLSAGRLFNSAGRLFNSARRLFNSASWFFNSASWLDTAGRLFNLFAARSFEAAHQATKLLSLENATRLDTAGRLFNTAGRLFNTAGRFDTAGRLFADNFFAAVVLVEHAVKFVLQHFHFANLKSTAWICATDRLTTTTN